MRHIAMPENELGKGVGVSHLTLTAITLWKTKSVVKIPEVRECVVIGVISPIAHQGNHTIHSPFVCSLFGLEVHGVLDVQDGRIFRRV